MYFINCLIFYPGLLENCKKIELCIYELEMTMRKFLFLITSLFATIHVCLDGLVAPFSHGGTLKSNVIRAAGEERINKLLTTGYSVNSLDERKRTPLHWAAIWARAEEAEALLNKDANIMAKDYQGNTPLHFAVQFDTNLVARAKVIETLLFFGADIYEQNNAGYSPIDLAYSYFFTKMLLSFDLTGVLS